MLASRETQVTCKTSVRGSSFVVEYPIISIQPSGRASDHRECVSCICLQGCHASIRDQPDIHPLSRLHALRGNSLCSFLLQYWLRTLSIVNNWHVVTVNVRGAGQRDSHHSELVPYASQRFHPLLHGNKFGTKHISLDGGLFLGVPIDWSHIQVDDETTSRTSRSLISRMIWVDEDA